MFLFACPLQENKIGLDACGIMFYMFLCLNQSWRQLLQLKVSICVTSDLKWFRLNLLIDKQGRYLALERRHTKTTKTWVAWVVFVWRLSSADYLPCLLILHKRSGLLSVSDCKIINVLNILMLSMFCRLFECLNSYMYSKCYVLKWILNMRALKYV